MGLGGHGRQISGRPTSAAALRAVPLLVPEIACHPCSAPSCCLAHHPSIPPPAPARAVFERCEYWRLRDNSAKPPGLMGWWPSRSVTFLENHDTVGAARPPWPACSAPLRCAAPLGLPAALSRWVWPPATSHPSPRPSSRPRQGSSQGHWRFPGHAVEQGYAYILTHPGTPCVFWDHLCDQRAKDMVARLVAIRKRAGIHCRSEVRAAASRAGVFGWLGPGARRRRLGPPWLRSTSWAGVAPGRACLTQTSCPSVHLPALSLPPRCRPTRSAGQDPQG